MLERHRRDPLAERPDRRLVRDGAERQHGAKVAESAAIVGVRNCRQVAISAGVGLFSGGTQRTALVIAVPTKLQPVVGPRQELAAGQAEADQRANRAGRRHSRR